MAFRRWLVCVPFFPGPASGPHRTVWVGHLPIFTSSLPAKSLKLGPMVCLRKNFSRCCLVAFFQMWPSGKRPHCWNIVEDLRMFANTFSCNTSDNSGIHSGTKVSWQECEVLERTCLAFKRVNHLAEDLAFLKGLLSEIDLRPGCWCDLPHVRVLSGRPSVRKTFVRCIWQWLHSESYLIRCTHWHLAPKIRCYNSFSFSTAWICAPWSVFPLHQHAGKCWLPAVRIFNIWTLLSVGLLVSW